MNDLYVRSVSAISSEIAPRKKSAKSSIAHNCASKTGGILVKSPVKDLLEIDSSQICRPCRTVL